MSCTRRQHAWRRRLPGSGLGRSSCSTAPASAHRRVATAPPSLGGAMASMPRARPYAVPPCRRACSLTGWAGRCWSRSWTANQCTSGPRATASDRRPSKALCRVSLCFRSTMRTATSRPRMARRLSPSGILSPQRRRTRTSRSRQPVPPLQPVRPSHQQQRRLPRPHQQASLRIEIAAMLMTRCSRPQPRCRRSREQGPQQRGGMRSVASHAFRRASAHFPSTLRAVLLARSVAV
mmetsp:Transcript_70435/g.204265  ORF Transcript_70435/g.204265 Transcript_70435/m.204265 type:complete len:235 (-) Transcript_70435:397-1101(-)